jgi:hypothetical protein
VNVVAKNSGKCLDVTGISTVPGAFLQQWSCWGGANQAFQFAQVQGGYEVSSKNSGLQLDVAGGSTFTFDGDNIIQWPYGGYTDEIFQLNPTSDGYYTITPLSDGKCLEVAGASTADGAQIVQWTCSGADNQKWQLVAAP